MEICFDDATSNSLYSRYTQTNNIDGYQSGYPRPGFVQGSDFYPTDLDVDFQYSRDGQTDAVAQAVGSASLAGQYVQSSGMIAKTWIIYSAVLLILF
jgi:hypothetical protein